MHRLYFAGFDADGDLTEQTTGADSEISKDGGTFADCTNELVSVKEVGGSTNSGFAYLDLTAAEMSASCVKLQIKSTNAKTTPIIVYPKTLVQFSTGTARTAGSPGNNQIQLATTEDGNNRSMRGVFVGLTGGTGAGQVRKISVYTGSTRMATVTADWGTNPSTDTTYELLLDDAVDVVGVKGVMSSSSGNMFKVSLGQILDGAVTETSVGYIAAAFTKLFDVATPVLTAASVNQTSDKPTAAQIVTAMWTALLASTDFSTASSIGKLLKDNIDAAISTRHASGAAVAKSPATLAAGDVTGNLPANLVTVETVDATDAITAAAKAALLDVAYEAVP
jgi:hypothetical protein